MSGLKSILLILNMAESLRNIDIQMFLVNNEDYDNGDKEG